MREIFNACLHKVSDFHEDLSVLQLKKIWDSENSRLFVEESSHFTSEGYVAYWAAIDSTVHFMDMILIQKILNKTAKKSKKESANNKPNKGKDTQGCERFRWQSDNYKKSQKKTEEPGEVKKKGCALMIVMMNISLKTRTDVLYQTHMKTIKWS